MLVVKVEEEDEAVEGRVLSVRNRRFGAGPAQGHDMMALTRHGDVYVEFGWEVGGSMAAGGGVEVEHIQEGDVQS